MAKVYTNWENYITCPHCGHADEDTCDYPKYLSEEMYAKDWECEECEQKFDVSVDVKWTFKSSAKSK